MTGQGSLARAVLPDYGHEITAADRKVHPVKRPCTARIGELDIHGLYYGIGLRRPALPEPLTVGA